MGFEQIDEACQAGVRAENADFATPTGNAGVNPLKIEKRNIYVNFPITFGNIMVSNATQSNSGAFPGINFPAASSSYAILAACSPRGEIASGEKGILKFAWWSATAPASDAIRFVAELAPVINGISSLSSTITRNVIQAAPAAYTLSIAKFEFPPAVFNSAQLWGLKLSRDPSNTLDTFSGDVAVVAIWMEILGRC